VLRRAAPALLVAALVAAVVFAWQRRGGSPPDLTRYAAEIERAARAAGPSGVEPALLMALVAAESGGDPEARSRAGAIGLCQLLPSTAAEVAHDLGIADYAPERLVEPALNLRLGAEYLARMLAAFEGEEALAIAAYNAGAANVRRWRQKAPDASPAEVIEREGFGETRRHVRKVLAWRAQYRARGG
jgi:soluble lytic murein transglycosylase